MTTVVVIEDDPWLASLESDVLRAAGYQVSTVAHGEGAMEVIDATAPNVIIADMLLASGTVLTLLNELRTYPDTAAIPVILCTNLAADINLKDLAPYGVTRVIDKTTMHPDDLVAAVKASL